MVKATADCSGSPPIAAASQCGQPPKAPVKGAGVAGHAARPCATEAGWAVNGSTHEACCNTNEAHVFDEGKVSKR